jgi:hypothetical protein
VPTGPPGDVRQPGGQEPGQDAVGQPAQGQDAGRGRQQRRRPEAAHPEQDHDRPGRRGSGQGRHHPDRHGVGQVQVVDGDQSRTRPPPQPGPETVHHGPGQRGRVRSTQPQGVKGGRPGRFGQLPQFRPQPDQQPLGHQAVEVALVVVAGRAQHPEAALAGDAGGGGQQGRGAVPGVGHDRRRGGATPGRVEKDAQRRQFLVAAEQVGSVHGVLRPVRRPSRRRATGCGA